MRFRVQMCADAHSSAPTDRQMATQECAREREPLDHEIEGDQLGGSDTEDESVDEQAAEEEYARAYHKRILWCESVAVTSGHEAAEKRMKDEVSRLEASDDSSSSAQTELKVLYNIQTAAENDGSLEAFLRNRRERDVWLQEARSELTADEQAAAQGALAALRAAIRNGTRGDRTGLSTLSSFGAVRTDAFAGGGSEESESESESESEGESDEDDEDDHTSATEAVPSSPPLPTPETARVPALPPMLPAVIELDRPSLRPTAQVAQPPPKRRRVEVEVIDLTK